LKPYEYPLYIEALSSPRSREAVRSIAQLGGQANYSSIEMISETKGSTLVYHLNRLVSLGVLESPTRGSYRLRYLTPLCFVYGCPRHRTAYFGLLGKREGRERPETAAALELLGLEGYTPDLVYVVTSPEALSEWSHLRLPYQWILCYEDEIIGIDSVKEKVLPQLKELIRGSLVILDCTSATKPATLAFYELAQTYMLPLIYVYEGQRRLHWLISKETVKMKLGIE